jgi:cytidine deaminase
LANHFEPLLDLLERSQATYSGFCVAAVVVTEDGRSFRGVNVESGAFSTTICAERNAIHTAVTEGARLGDLREVHILARNGNGKLVGAYPCGACRQVIAEQSGNAARIFIYTSAEEVFEHPISELLPNGFFGDRL